MSVAKLSGIVDSANPFEPSSALFSWYSDKCSTEPESPFRSLVARRFDLCNLSAKPGNPDGCLREWPTPVANGSGSAGKGYPERTGSSITTRVNSSHVENPVWGLIPVARSTRAAGKLCPAIVEPCIQAG